MKLRCPLRGPILLASRNVDLADDRNSYTAASFYSISEEHSIDIDDGGLLPRQ